MTNLLPFNLRSPESDKKWSYFGKMRSFFTSEVQVIFRNFSMCMSSTLYVSYHYDLLLFYRKMEKSCFYFLSLFYYFRRFWQYLSSIFQRNLNVWKILFIFNQTSESNQPSDWLPVICKSPIIGTSDKKIGKNNINICQIHPLTHIINKLE